MGDSISIVIPTYDRPDALTRLLEVLGPQAEAASAEVIVVDDGSSLPDISVLVEERGHRCIRVPNGGAASARNHGWRAATGDVVVFIDDDVVPEDGWLGALVAPLAESDAVGVGGGIHPLSGGTLSAFVQAEQLVNHAVEDDGTVRYLVTANVAFRRTALEAVGGFSTDFPGAAGEDVDLSLRIHAVGRLVLAPDAVVRHEHRISAKALFRTYQRHGRARRRLSSRHPGLGRSRGVVDVLQPGHWTDRFRGYRSAGMGRAMAATCLLLHAACLLIFLISACSPVRRAVPRADVVLLNDVAEIGGGQQLTVDLASMLTDLDKSVLVASPEGWLANRCAELGVKHVPFHFRDQRMLFRGLRVPTPVALARRVGEARDLRKLMADSGASVLHTVATVPHVVGSLASVGSAWSLVWHLNQVGPRGLAALPLPDHCLSPSEAALVPLRRRRALLRRMVVAPNPIDTQRFRPPTKSERQEARALFGVDDEQLVISCAARLEPLKGLHYLIEAAAALPDATVLIAGAQDDRAVQHNYRRQLAIRGAELGLDLRLLGPRLDVERILQASDIAAFPSLWEGFGLFAAEAGCTGVPVVASATGGIPEVVEDGKTGFLVPPGNVEALRCALESLASDRHRRAVLGSAAVAHCRSSFDGSALRSALEAVYG